MIDALPVSEVPAYTYEPPTTSPFYRHVISPLLDQVVRHIPESVLPDHLTSAGLACAIGAAAILPLSPLAAAMLWLGYATLDNLDGKHARRTHQSSVRGEFLDHIVDSATCCLLVYMLSYGFIGVQRRAHLIVSLATQTPFLLACWYYSINGRVLLGSTWHALDGGPLITVDEINYLAIPILFASRRLLKRPLIGQLTLGSIALYASAAGCLVAAVIVYLSITEGRTLPPPGQRTVAGAAGLYLGLAACLNLSPLLTLPAFVWLCSVLIYPNCAKKKQSKVTTTLFQIHVAGPSVAITALAVAAATAHEAAAFTRVIIGAITVAVLAVDLRALS